MVVGSETPKPGRWTRSYPPLLLLVLAAIVAAFILPSSLNLPQSNPSTVLEYAPVPPEDDEPPPSDGNASALGLGSSRSLTNPVSSPPPPPPPPPGGGDGKVQRNRDCVGHRQTDDPMSPPCVAYFEGSNFGSTYQGVDGKEIDVIVYLDRGCPNFECSKASGTYEDLDQPPKPRCPKTWPAGNPNENQCDYIWIRTARAFNKYFNAHFQTYGRRVHYYAFVTSANSAATRKADAVELWQRQKPFAVIDYATYNGHNEAFASSLAARGVLTFQSRAALTNAFYRQNAPLSWGFYPDVERWAEMYTSYVCQRVAKQPVTWGGNPRGSHPDVGKERRFGLFYTTDQAEPGLQLFRKLVQDGLRACGVNWVAEGSFPNSGFVVKASDSGTTQNEAITEFQAKGVTTVLYLGGIEGKFSQLADQRKWYPEIVIAGDLKLDNNENGRKQNQNVWQNVWGPQMHLRLDRPEETVGWRAYKEASPEADAEDARFANEQYRDHFMLFQAIQVAGPKLNPNTVDKGFHAIPEHSSTSPYIASCFFEVGDYTCTKDSMEVWWDPTGPSPGASEPGCHRMVADGKRFLAWTWPDAGKQPLPFGSTAEQPCTGFESRFQIDPS